MYPFYSERFFHGTIRDMSRAIEVGSLVGVVVEYEEPNNDRG